MFTNSTISVGWKPGKFAEYIEREFAREGIVFCGGCNQTIQWQGMVYGKWICPKCKRVNEV